MSEMDEDERRREKKPPPEDLDVRLSRVCTGCCCGGGTGSWFLWPKRGIAVLPNVAVLSGMKCVGDYDEFM